MKKFLMCLCCVTLVFCCGCGSYREINQGFLVTAIGFEKQDNNVKIVLETVFDSEKTEDESNLLSGEGESFESAYGQIKNTLVKKLYFEHCGVVAIDVGFTENEIAKILKFYQEISTVNTGVYAVRTNNATSLFKTRTKSESVGYDIINLIKNSNKVFSNQLYQINRQNFNVELPIINSKNNTLILE